MPRQVGQKKRGGVRIRNNNVIFYKAKRIARNKQEAFAQAGIDVTVSPIIVKGHFIACVALPSRSTSTDTYHHDDLVYRTIPAGTYFCSLCGNYVDKDHPVPCPDSLQKLNDVRYQK
ncbi:hypothetical protein ACXHQL_25155 [Vibrio parahaemolyticus]|uniref:hypothetical protein n=1 Tax=Vibrio parahaemolyticus TaxID=670 RepID=UPI001D165C22|nr:hypothetical protein [Vibrio parahaemolyticus]EHW0694780.1 hypothetical protein [Vibrio parahaemolyticus]EIU6802866.1 hypothetical protein [Vibrio parahaemolyticus]MCC3798706.1 hypothetical protein [Vibrio parahaemolyticus]MCC3813575.1 hypothetical protein [Vibrio parahaemolyticus]